MGQLEYFPAFFGYLDSLRLLDDAQVGRVFRAALRYAKDGTMPDLDAVEMMAFAFIRGDIDRARSKYDDICEKRREAINKRWQNTGENPGDTNEYKSIDGIQKNTSGSKQDKTTQNKTKQHNTNDGVASDDAAPAQKKPKKKEFVPPTVEEVREYCGAQGLTIDAERFVDYYEANGWKVGNQGMKDWKAAVRNWARRDKERGYDTSKPAANKPAASSFDTDDFFDAALKRTYGENWQFFKEGMDG